MDENEARRDSRSANGEDDGPVDEEHSDVIDAEQREKHDEDEEANHLLHGEDLPDPAIEP